MQGSDVLEAQQSLVRKGYAIGADGVFGPSTDRAVKQFQQKSGLVADGVVGTKTWELLLERVLYLTTPNMQGEDVRRLQDALRKQGISVTVDGVFGPGTDVAVRKFQTQKGLLPDGIVGQQTRTALGI
jgi:peptidoglycan hydrolase-like protein with peptidoglycan-binding domain